jgi:YfiH family protein
MIANQALPHFPALLNGTHEVPHYLFPRLSNQSFMVHAVFTRHGGESKAPYATLNISYGTGDLPRDVQANINIMKSAIGTERLCYLEQVHGSHTVVAQSEICHGTQDVPRGDALITHRTGLALMVKQADCQAVILCDPVKRVLANVHCGWRGNVQNILGSVVERMQKAYGSKPSHLLAAIGPSLGPCCGEFLTHEEIFPESFRPFMVRENHFDLWAVSCWQLMEAGLDKDNIELARVCTKCRNDLFFSYRAEKTTGRFATLAMLKE